MRPRVDLLATLPHYLDHLAPLWLALPDELRGGAWYPGHLAEHAAALGLPPARVLAGNARAVTLVAGHADERRCRGPVVMVEHGAGQSYGGVLAGQPPGRRRRDLALVLAPGQTAAEGWEQMGLGVPILDVGSARLAALRARRSQTPDNDRSTVAFAWHWPQGRCPESGTAWHDWADAAGEAARALSAAGCRTVGTGHPRAMPYLAPWYMSVGVEVIDRDAARVLAQADVLVGDNTSLLWEACALDVPVVLLDARAWSPSSHHGLRFWTHADAGPRLSYPHAGNLADAVVLTGGDGWSAARAAAAVACYSSWEPEVAVGALADLADQAAVTGGDRMPTSRTDPFRGTRRARPPAAPSVADLRDQITGYFAFAGVEPTRGQVAAFDAMDADELRATAASLAALTPGELRALQDGPDVTATAGEDGDEQWGDPPEAADERIAAIAGDPERARWVLAHELARPESRQRSTVIDAANAVLGTEPS